MKKVIQSILVVMLLLGVIALTLPTNASEMAPPKNPEEVLSEAYTGKSYSPYAGRSFPSRPLWGDSHLHTGNSFDAGAFGARLQPEDAYRFARGEEVVSSTGIPVKLSRPLDWLVVADHSDNMGFFTDLIAGKPHLMSDPQAKDWYNRIQEGKGVGVAYEIISLFANQKFPERLMYSPDSKPFKSIWQRTIDAAEEYNDPHSFTAFIGYEWTSLIKGNNMHRVVIYRDGADKGSLMVPYTTTPPHGSENPRELWKWLNMYEEKTGGDILAIAHNGNLSNGIMFPFEAQYNGKKLDEGYVTQRSKWEPLYEVTQIKGDGEAHPLLSPEDEFADYETWDIGNLDDPPTVKTDDMIAGEYAREALKRGLALETRLGTNPYKFGLVGSTDSHTGLATAQEDNFFGKHSGAEPSPKRMGHPFMSNEKGTIMGWAQVSSGLAAVWASENTRESIFDAMERKEVYATTGSRMMVRFFGGWDFTDADIESRSPAFTGYQKGVPMGGDLSARKGNKAPSFMAYALRDPIGGNLDRIQIIKGWMDSNGKTHEKVYDVVWSGDLSKAASGQAPTFMVRALRDSDGANLDRIQIVKGWLDKNGKAQERIYDIAVSDGRKIGPDGRCKTLVGDTVDNNNATFTNTIGNALMAAYWKDPAFDPSQRAFYYVRVLEIPTPTWLAYDRKALGVELPKEALVKPNKWLKHQERAYTSPIWYTP